MSQNPASLHGAGFRLVFQQGDLQNAADREKPVFAELFGPDGRVAPSDAERPNIGTLTLSGKLALNLSSDDLATLENLLAKDSPAPMKDGDRIDRLIAAPVRVYSSLMPLGTAPEQGVLDRLGELSDALLTDYGFAPPPPVPPPMTCTPAAYTYLGQFLAHELTLFRVEKDAAGPGTATVIDSAIDLKTIFREPDDFPKTLPKHVTEAEGLALGQTLSPDTKKTWTGGPNDVPRKQSGQALLFEMRNDQNLAVSQMHVAITRFAQNALRRLQRDGLPEDEHRGIILRHFQSVVLQDYLVRLIDPMTYADVMQNGRLFVAPSAKGALPPLFFVPIEFSAAIFRFGHVMRRDSYEPWNTMFPNHSVDSALASQLLGLTYGGGGLTNGQLIENWATDWRFLLGTSGFDPIKAKKIGTDLSKSLFCLPARLFVPSANSQPCAGGGGGDINLARRTLVGGAQLGLASGQALAKAVEAKLRQANSPCSIPILTPSRTEIPGNARATQIMGEGSKKHRFTEETPLWLYILREAAVWGGGDRLGPLGSRIVCETINAAIEASGSGMIDGGVQMPFTPEPSFGGRHPDKFDLHDLVRLAYATAP